MKAFVLALLVSFTLTLPLSLIAQSEYDLSKTVPLVAYRKGQLWGYADTSGVIKITPQFDRLNRYYINEPTALITVWKQGKQGLINTIGEQVLAPIYDQITQSAQHSLIVAVQNGRYGVFDPNTLKFILKCTHKNAPLIHTKGEGFDSSPQLYAIKEGNKYAIINQKGKIVSKYQYDRVVHAGSYLVISQSGKRGLLSLKGKKITDLDFDKILPNRMHPGFAFAYRGKQMTLLNASGKVLLEGIDQGNIRNAPRGFIFSTNEKSGFIGTNGSSIVADYQQIKIFPLEGQHFCIAVKKGDKYALFNEEGKAVTDFDYAMLKHLIGDLFVFSPDLKTGQLGVLRKDGKIIRKTGNFDYIQSSDGQQLAIKEESSKRYFLADPQLQATEEARYTTVHFLENSALFARIDQTEGLIRSADGSFVYQGNLTSAKILSKSSPNWYQLITEEKVGKKTFIRKGLFNTLTHVFIPPKYERIQFSTQQSEFMKVQDSVQGNWALLAANGQVLSAFDYLDIQLDQLTPPFACTRSDKEAGLLTTAGKFIDFFGINTLNEVWQKENSDLYMISKRVAGARHLGVYNSLGNRVIALDFHVIKFHSNHIEVSGRYDLKRQFYTLAGDPIETALGYQVMSVLPNKDVVMLRTTKDGQQVYAIRKINGDFVIPPSKEYVDFQLMDNYMLLRTPRKNSKAASAPFALYNRAYDLITFGNYSTISDLSPVKENPNFYLISIQTPENRHQTTQVYGIIDKNGKRFFEE